MDVKLLYAYGKIVFSRAMFFMGNARKGRGGTTRFLWKNLVQFIRVVFLCFLLTFYFESMRFVYTFAPPTR
jgi:hypothetical protein